MFPYRVIKITTSYFFSDFQKFSQSDKYLDTSCFTYSNYFSATDKFSKIFGFTKMRDFQKQKNFHNQKLLRILIILIQQKISITLTILHHPMYFQSHICLLNRMFFYQLIDFQKHHISQKKKALLKLLNLLIVKSFHHFCII